MDVKIPDGTPIEVVLKADVSSEAVQEGADQSAMTVARDVVANGLIVVQHGSEARARVIAISEPGRMGRPGEVSGPCRTWPPRTAIWHQSTSHPGKGA